MHFEAEEGREKSETKVRNVKQCGLGGNAKHFRLGPEGGPKAIRHLRSGLWQCNHLWLNLGRPRSKASTKVMKMGTQFEQAHISKAVDIGIVKNGIKPELKQTKLGQDLHYFFVESRRSTFNWSICQFLSWHHRGITYCVRIANGRAQRVTQKHRQVVQRSRSDPKSAQG